MARYLTPILLVAMAAALVAGCAVPASSAAPSATDSPTPTDSPIPIGSVPPASALATSIIACDLAADTLHLSLHTPRGLVDAQGSLVASNGASPALSGASPSAPSAPTSGGPTAAGELVGGQTYPVDLTLELNGGVQSIMPKAVQGTVSVAGHQLPATVATDGASVGVTLPDGSGDAVLSLGFTLDNSPCPDLLSTIQLGMTLVPAATAAKCPSAASGYASLVQSLDTRLKVGGTTRRFTVGSYSGRFVSATAADQVPPLAGFNPSLAPISVPAGKSVAITPVGSDVALIGADIAIWPRSAVLGADGKVKATLPDPTAQQSLAAKDGGLTWTAPKKGDYIVGLLPRWSQACMTGQGYLYLAVSAT
jgi:hypothetical protein